MSSMGRELKRGRTGRGRLMHPVRIVGRTWPPGANRGVLVCEWCQSELGDSRADPSD